MEVIKLEEEKQTTFIHPVIISRVYAVNKR